MRQRTKVRIKLWANRFLFSFLIALIVWANIIRLQDNVYSNYEKAADYGSIKEVKRSIDPIIAAVFYADKNGTRGNVSTYFNHADNYKKKNVKMVIVPKKVTKYASAVIEKLYEEIRKHNVIQNVILVHDEYADVRRHRKILNQVMDVKNIHDYFLSDDNLAGEKEIEKYLNTQDNVVVLLADLNKGLEQEDSDFLVQEAVFWAQKYFYQMQVFDIIDTHMAKALDKDYASLIPLTGKDEPMVVKQKENLERYKERYWRDLTGYFEGNFVQLATGNEALLPQKNEDNYRLYDRGSLVVKVYDEEYNEIFETVKFEQQNGLIVSVADAARDFVAQQNYEKAAFLKMYLLTDKELINWDKNTMLMSYLDQDDGVFARYKKYTALLVADDRPDDPEDLVVVLRKKAHIPEDVPDEDIHFYKFKTVEIEYGY